MSDLEKALEWPTPRLDNELIEGESLYLIIPDFVLDHLKDAARRFASLTSPEDVQVLRESWQTISRHLPLMGSWNGELLGSFAVIDHHFNKALRSVEEGTE